MHGWEGDLQGIPFDFGMTGMLMVHEPNTVEYQQLLLDDEVFCAPFQRHMHTYEDNWVAKDNEVA